MAGNDTAPIKLIHTAAAATPGGHYSQAVRHQGVLYISGQLPVHTDGRHGVEETFEVQAAIALENVLQILAAANGGVGDLLKVTVYIVGIENWPVFDRVYSRYLGAHRPARAVVPVPQLHHGYLVEIEALARASAQEANQ